MTTPTYKITTQIQAQGIFDNLPAKFRNSAVGGVYQHIIENLDPDGQVAADALLTELFSDCKTTALAKRKLSTGYISRPHAQEDGIVPLRMCLARAKGDVPSIVSFETELAIAAPIMLDMKSPRNPARQFTETLATAVTSAEMEQNLSEADEEPSPNIQVAEAEVLLNQRDLKRPLHGLPTESLRAQVSEEVFTDTPAHQTIGIHEHDEMEPEDRNFFWSEAKLRRQEPVTESVPIGAVNCLDAMLSWAVAKDKSGQPNLRLLALLGDYGTGKTSHAVQFTRVLNGSVSRPVWDALTKKLPSHEPMPQALLLDLAELAEVSNIAAFDFAEMVQLILRKRAGGEIAEGQLSFAKQAQHHIAQARAGHLIFVFDGLDELVRNDRSVLTHVFTQLLRVLEPSQAQINAGQSSRARVIISCRTHYFRDAVDMRGFFNTRQRGVAQASEYLRLTLLPWGQEDIRSYLAKRLPSGDASKLLQIIDTTYNLNELASRPVLLAMMSEQLGALLRVKTLGKPITAASMYAITVSEWVQRDNSKHLVTAAHKPLLMGALACAMWSADKEAWNADVLDRWVLKAVKQLFPDQYDTARAQAIQDDIRTATFIVRPGAARFSFAHRSFSEYFIARFIWDALVLTQQGVLDDATLRALLPQKSLNTESRQFLREIWEEQAGRFTAEQLGELVEPVWRLLQHDPQGTGSANAKLKSAPQLHQSLFEIAIAQNWMGLPRRVHLSAGTTTLSTSAPLNLRGIYWYKQHWVDLNFGHLPAWDARGCNFTYLRAVGCNFCTMICDAETRWDNVVLRDCKLTDINWAQSRLHETVACESLPYKHIELPAAKKSPKTKLGVLHADTRLSEKTAAFKWQTADGELGPQNIAMTSDGTGFLILSRRDPQFYWWSNTSKTNPYTFQRGSILDSYAAISPDGRCVAIASGGVIELFEHSTGALMRRFMGEFGNVDLLKFSSDGGRIFVGSKRQGFLNLLDANSGKVVGNLSVKLNDSSVVDLSPNGDTVFISDASKNYWLASFSDSTFVLILKEQRLAVCAANFSRDGNSLVSVVGERNIMLWDTQTGKLLCSINTKYGSFLAAALVDHECKIIGYRSDGTLVVWDSITGAKISRRRISMASLAKRAIFSENTKFIALQHYCYVELICLESIINKLDSTKNQVSTHAYRRVFTHGNCGPSTAAFDEEGNLLDWNDEAENTWLRDENGDPPHGRSIFYRPNAVK